MFNTGFDKVNGGVVEVFIGLNCCSVYAVVVLLLYDSVCCCCIAVGGVVMDFVVVLLFFLGWGVNIYVNA